MTPELLTIDDLDAVPWSDDAQPVEPIHEWPDLIPLDTRPAPSRFPVDALPRWLAAWVDAQAIELQVAADMVGMLALGVLAAGAQRVVRARVRPGWDEQPSLFVAVAAEPGSRKSAAFSRATIAVRRWERQRGADLRDATATAKARRKSLERQRDRASDPDDAARLALDVEAVHVPISPRVVTDDATSEALAGLLAEHGAIAVMAAEGCGLFDLMGGRYRDSGPAFDLYLKAHQGDPLVVDRAGRPPLRVDEPRLSIVTTTQPDAIRGLARMDGARGLGLLARFLFVAPPNLVGMRAPSPGQASARVVAEYDDAITRLLDLEPGTDGPHIVLFSGEAQARMVDYLGKIEPRLGPAGDLHAIADWAAKLTGVVARIATLLHIAEYPAEQRPWTREVTEAHVCAAIKLGDYLLAHALVAFDAMGMDPVVERARIVWRHIEGTRRTAFSKRDLYQELRGRSDFAVADELDGPLRTLVEHGYLFAEPSPKRPGRPSPRFRVRPRDLPKTLRTRDARDFECFENAPQGNT